MAYFFNKSVFKETESERRSFYGKKGISLIAVLMFMLLATIGATMVFRWLSSENFASAHRLKQSEAYQASQAGIETLRGWLANNAAGTGKLVTDFKKGGKQPIGVHELLNHQFGTVPGSVGQQQFRAYLVGVEEPPEGETGTIKLKFAVSGIARDDSRHEQIAILAVNGLYKIKKPKQEPPPPNVPAFSGENDKFVNAVKIESACINGDYSGNLPEIEKYIVVNGKTNLEGASGNSNVSGDFYGSDDFENRGSTVMGTLGKNNIAYFGGKLNCADSKLTINGDAYFNGGVDKSCFITVNGNATVNGTLSRGDNNGIFKVSGSLVFTGGDSSFFEVNQYSQNLTAAGNFNVNGNVLLPHSITRIGTDPSYLIMAGNNKEIYTNLSSSFSLTNKQSSSVNSTSYDRYNLSEDPTNVFILTQGSLGAQKITNSPAIRKLWGFEASDSARSKYAASIVNGSIPDPVNLVDESELLSNDKSGECKVTKLNDASIAILNKCYQDNPQWRYPQGTDGFLVVKLEPEQNANATTKLNGKFVIILTPPSSIIGQQRLPATESNAVVMLYLPEGFAYNLQPSNHNEYYKYFIYSGGDIKEFTSWGDNRTIAGGVVMANGSRLLAANGNTVFKTDKDVINSLTKANIIKRNEDFKCGAAIAGSDDVGEITLSGALDDDYSPMSPRLKVTLESQYISKEPAVNCSDCDLKPSILVMPRVIYMGTNSSEPLENYYKVLFLNGAKEQAVSSGCSDNLSPGLNECTVTAAGNLTSKFWAVKVDKPLEEVRVSMNIYKNLQLPVVGGEDCNNPVTMNVTGDIMGDITVNIKMLGNLSSGLTFTPASGVLCSGNNCTVTVSSKGSKNLGNVCYNSNATIDNFITFTVETSPDYLGIGSVEYYVVGTGEVRRGDLQDGNEGYCNAYPTNGSVNACTCPVGTPVLGVRTTNPSGGTNGDNCTLTSTDSWRCSYSSTYSNAKLLSENANNNDICELVVKPGDFPALDANSIQTVYGELQRKVHTLEVTFLLGTPSLSVLGYESGNQSKHYENYTVGVNGCNDTADPDLAGTTCTYRKPSCNNNTKKCIIYLYRGLSYNISIADGFWKCPDGENCSDFSAFLKSSGAIINYSPTANRKLNVGDYCDYQERWCKADNDNTTAPAAPIDYTEQNYPLDYNSNVQSPAVCIFATSIELLTQGRKVNGSDTQISCGRTGWSQPSCEEALKDIPKADGGYFIYIPAYTVIGKDGFRTIGGTPPTCGEFPEPSSSSSAAAGASSSSSAGVTLNCNNPPPSTAIEGQSITKPTITCSNNEIPTRENWVDEPQWYYLISRNYPYDLSVTADCGTFTNLVTSCGSLTVNLSGGENGTDYCNGVTPNVVKSTNVGTTNAVCAKISGSIAGWQVSNVSGRSCSINGGTLYTPENSVNQPSASAMSDGYVYIYCTAGDYTYFSMNWW